MRIKEIRVLGVDPSLSRCGIALLRVRFGKRIEAEIEVSRVAVTDSIIPIEDRLLGIMEMVKGVAEREPDLSGVEDFARNARFRREEMGMATGAVLIGLTRLRLIRREHSPSMVSPREAKRTVCPEWHGWNKQCWTAAGCTGKFKMSMPDKVSVMRGLHKRFGIKTDDDAVADACCVALHVACRALNVNSESVGN